MQKKWLSRINKLDTSRKHNRFPACIWQATHKLANTYLTLTMLKGNIPARYLSIRSTALWLGIILIIGSWFRLHNLVFQSLWCDELITAKETDPGLPLSALWVQLRTGDIQPPFYFILQRVLFQVFGYTEFVGRLTAACTGILGIYAMYRLGCAIKGKPLGLICAWLLSINIFHIRYSQEVRPYALAFLLATLSFAYFIELIKNVSKKNSLWYCLYTLLLIYTHYYGLFVLMAQAILGVVFWISVEEKEVRKKLGYTGLAAGAIIFTAYLPWLSFFRSATHYTSGWIPAPEAGFASVYLSEFFGNFSLLNTLVYTLLIFFAILAFLPAIHHSDTSETTSFPVTKHWLTVIVWIVCVLLIPYVYSIVKTPMLQPRYTIVVLPAIISALAAALHSISEKLVRVTMIILFTTLSLVNIIFVARYYTNIDHSQFREMSAYVAKENTEHYLVNNGTTAWQQSFYLQKMATGTPLSGTEKTRFTDSILSLTGNQPTGFWLVGAHHETRLDSSSKNKLEKQFRLVKSTQFVDAWAELYLQKKYADDNMIVIKYSDYEASPNMAILDKENLLAVWNGNVRSKKMELSPGRYKLTVNAKGTKAQNGYPHFWVIYNGKVLGDFQASQTMESKHYFFTIDNSVSERLVFNFDNDAYEPGVEDRNLFLSECLIQKIR